ncbi:MAG: hypothetical protein COZ95_05305 [Nitrospirae bacterium CG_4_8_14_3_um_filter_50_41]|nr:MAG: hypothetical protein COZ95_05305 [Nitrospirae bacterium CG_4_8_14_3_um_filter_50_41]
MTSTEKARRKGREIPHLKGGPLPDGAACVPLFLVSGGFKAKKLDCPVKPDNDKAPSSPAPGVIPRLDRGIQEDSLDCPIKSDNDKAPVNRGQAGQ